MNLSFSFEWEQRHYMTMATHDHDHDLLCPSMNFYALPCYDFIWLSSPWKSQELMSIFNPWSNVRTSLTKDQINSHWTPRLDPINPKSIVSPLGVMMVYQETDIDIYLTLYLSKHGGPILIKNGFFCQNETW